MVQKLRGVVMKDAPTTLSMEEYVLDMAQGGIVAAVKDVPTMPSEEEYVVGMVPKGRITSADKKDVPILFS